MKKKGLQRLDSADSSILRARWPLIFFTMVFLIMLSFLFFLKYDEFHAGSYGGITYGILGISAIIFLSLYRIRRSIYKFRVGSVQGWLMAHIYIGIISLLLIILHTGFRFHGTFSLLLFVLFLLVIVSGIIGGLIYSTIPLSLSKHEREIMPVEDIIVTIDKFTIEAEAYVKGKSGKLLEVYKKHIGSCFKGRMNWKHLFLEEREVINGCRRLFAKLKEKVDPGDLYDMDMLESLYVDKERMAFKLSKLRNMKTWLNFHVPVAAAMLTAALFHILSIWYY